MIISSSSFKNYQQIPSRYTCDGKNISPPLTISKIPSATKSLVLIVDDPDAVPFAGHVWDHWLVFNITSTIKIIPENTVPTGSVEGMTSYGKSGWGGPCPPAGNHYYHFKLYALDKILNLTNSSNKQDLESSMNGHILARAELIGSYQKNI